MGRFVKVKIFIFFIFFLSGCSFKSHSTNTSSNSTLVVEFPNELKSKIKSQKNQKDLNSGKIILPKELLDFNCFGILITGSGIPSDSRLTCTSVQDPNGLFAGFSSIQEGSISLNVDPGPKRKIQIFALKTDLSIGCPSLDSILNTPPTSRWNGIGQFYEVASTTVDISSDMTLQMKATFDADHPKILFQNCMGKVLDSQKDYRFMNDNRFKNSVSTSFTQSKHLKAFISIY